VGTNTMMNLHTHTRYSDGEHRPERIISKAAREGVSHIAITDHFMTSKVHCLREGNLKEYLSTLRRLREKYEGSVNVLAGVEIDTNPGRCDLEGLPFKEMGELDIVLFEYAGDGRFGGAPLDRIGDLASKIEAPCGLAHTDLCHVLGGMSPEEAADAIRSLGLFVEVNTALPYQHNGLFFFEEAEPIYRLFHGKVKVSVGTDVHHRLSEVSNLKRGYQFIKKAGLREDLLF